MPKKIKLPIHYSPKAVARYPHLHKPDTKFDPAGVFKVSLIVDVDDPQVQPFLDKLRAAAQEAYDAALGDLKEKKKFSKVKALKLHVPIQPEFDDSGEETGRFIVGEFKQKHRVMDREGNLLFEQKPDMVDGRGKPIKKVVQVWGGSVIKVAYQIVPFNNSAADSAGVSLRLKAVQIIELAQGSGGSYSGFADEGGDTFEDEEDAAGGFEDESEEDSDETGAPEDF